jgi:mannose-6-phosphate isomerase-like protein (cupin superfamily)
MTDAARVRILKDDENCPDLPIVDGSGRAWAVVWPGVGARFRSLHHISLDSRSRTVELTHPMEAVYYVMEGTATALDTSHDSRQELRQGSMAHVDPGTSYVFEAGPEGAEILGGPCPPDPNMYAHIEGDDGGAVYSLPSMDGQAISPSGGMDEGQ